MTQDETDDSNTLLIELDSSPRGRRLVYLSGVLAAVSGLVAAVIPAITSAQDIPKGIASNSESQTSTDPITWIWISAVMIAVILGIALTATIYSFRQSYLRRKQLERLQNQERLAAKDALELQKIWALNQERLDYYHNIAIAQSRQSFISSQIAMAVGFVLIISVGWMAAHATSIPGSIASGAVGVVGGGLSAYIGATYMKSQAVASAQLRLFFMHPVEFSRVIGAERLALNLKDGQLAEAINNIISEMMNPEHSSPRADGKEDKTPL